MSFTDVSLPLGPSIAHSVSRTLHVTRTDSRIRASHSHDTTSRRHTLLFCVRLVQTNKQTNGRHLLFLLSIVLLASSRSSRETRRTKLDIESMTALRFATSTPLRRSLGSTALTGRCVLVSRSAATTTTTPRMYWGNGGTNPFYLSLQHNNIPLAAALSVRKLVTQAAAAQQQGQQKTRSHWWYRFANFVRYVRIPALVLGVYSLGYQQGIMDCTKTPKMLQDKIMNTILVEQGVKDMKHVKVVGDAELRRFGSGKEYHGVAAVGQNIIQAARAHVQVKLSESMEKVREKLPDDMEEHILEQHYAKDPDCEYWYNAGLRLMGENDNPWHYVFIQTSLPNAFVTGECQKQPINTETLCLQSGSADSQISNLAFVVTQKCCLSGFSLRRVCWNWQNHLTVRLPPIISLLMYGNHGDSC